MKDQKVQGPLSNLQSKQAPIKWGARDPQENVSDDGSRLKLSYTYGKSGFSEFHKEAKTGQTHRGEHHSPESE